MKTGRLTALLITALIALFVAAPAQADITFGAFTDDAPYNGNVDAINTLEQQLGRKVGIVNWYQAWGGGDWISQVQPSVVGAVSNSGRAPMLTWEPWTPEAGAEQPEFALQNVAAGNFDAYITKFATDLKNLGTTVYLRPMHEMNGNWYPWGGTVNGNSAKTYKAAFKHVVSLFRAAGATNVKFVWCALTESVPAIRSNRMEKYFPGNKWVDVLALDGYDWGAAHPEAGGERSFKQVFSAPYKRLQKLSSKPIWIAEVGAAGEDTAKAQWIRSMWETASKMTQLDAIVWFDQNKEQDWRAASTPAVAAAFRSAS